MTTARDLIEDAAAEIGVFASDSALSDADAQIMLRRLNRMMDSWSAEGLAVYERYDESLTLSANVASYSTALLAGGRPVRVDGVTVTVGGVDYDMRMVSKANYDEIGYKSVAGIPDMCYVQMGMPDATLYFYPAPSAAYTAVSSPRRSTAAAGITTGPAAAGAAAPWKCTRAKLPGSTSSTPAGRSTRTRTVWVRASAAGSTVTAAASMTRPLAGSSTLARSGPAPSSARRCGARSATARICAGS